MARRSNPARLVVALSIAALLAVFLLYTSIAGGGTVSIQPSQLAAHQGDRVKLAGYVLEGTVRDRAKAREGGMRFRLRDVDGTKSVAVLYRGSVPDLFAEGRHVVVDGMLRDGRFVADTMVTKCPSKYEAKKGT